MEQTKCILAVEEIFSGGEDRKEEKAFAEDSVYSFRNVFDLFCPTLKEHKATEIIKAEFC